MEGVDTKRGGYAVAHYDVVQAGASIEGARTDAGDTPRQFHLPQAGAAVERPRTNGLDGGRQDDVAQLRAALEPRGAHVVEADALEPLEVGEGVNLVLLSRELAVEPREAGTADAGEVAVVVPQRLVGVRVRWVVVGHLLQRLLHTRVGEADDARHEAVLVGRPCGVGLEPRHLLRHHLEAGRRAVEHPLADGHHLRSNRGDFVRAVGHQVEQVEVGKVRAVNKRRVAEVHLQPGVAVADGTEAVEVGERHAPQVLVALEGLRHHGVQLVVVVRADVVAELHGTLVPGDELVVGAGDDGVLDEVASLLVLLLDGVLLVGVGVVRAILAVLVLGLCVLVYEEALQRGPRGVVEEVLLAQGVDDDVELQRVKTGEDAVAAEDEVLRAEGARAVAVGMQQRAELREVGAANEGRVGDGERQRGGCVAGAGVFFEAYRSQVGLVPECFGVECNRGGGLVGASPTSGFDDGILHIVGHIPYKSMVNEVLLRCGDHIATTHEAHLVDVGQDVLAHALVHQVGIVGAAATPTLRGEDGGSVGRDCKRASI